MMMAREVLLALLLAAALVAPACAGISASTGETWIRWTWTDLPVIENETQILVDGTVQGVVGPENSLYLTDLRPAEEHRISFVNATSGEILAALRTATLPAMSTILFFLGVLVVLAVLCMVLQDGPSVVMCGALGLCVAVYLFTLTLGHGLILSLVVLALLIFQGYFAGRKAYELLEENLAWW
ncbi:MAG: hypothetical protein WC145_13605 [Aliarcobacter sp.]|jgi:hypothetical protein